MKIVKKQKGFTLVELMIVIAIVGILAAVAMPMYQDYTNKAGVSPLRSAADGYKAATAQCVHNKGELAGCDNGVDNIKAAIDAAAGVPGVKSLSVKNGVITVESTNANVGTYTLTPKIVGGLVVWTEKCTNDEHCKS